ncbi:MAG TPA: phosphatase PAP2 family protein [Gammaproteobacteria bacterium]|nr:phosphatase PAP2 family protein [Gammaproteobacteria bacterium]
MRFWLTHAILPAALLFILTVLLEYSQFDIHLANYFFDFENRRWMAGESWWANQLLHKTGRDFIALIAFISLLGFVFSWFSKRLHPWRRTFAYAVLSILLTTSLVFLGKKYSNVDCPWDLAMYNGKRPYTQIFSDKADNIDIGRCFPGGHSSGAFSLLFLYFLLRDKNRRLAFAGLGFALLLGSLYSYGQWVRGAHFISHDIWSAFIAWFVALGLYRGLFKGRVWPD